MNECSDCWCGFVDLFQINVWLFSTLPAAILVCELWSSSKFPTPECLPVDTSDWHLEISEIPHQLECTVTIIDTNTQGTKKRIPGYNYNTQHLVSVKFVLRRLVSSSRKYYRYKKQNTKKCVTVRQREHMNLRTHRQWRWLDTSGWGSKQDTEGNHMEGNTGRTSRQDTRKIRNFKIK